MNVDQEPFHKTLDFLAAFSLTEMTLEQLLKLYKLTVYCKSVSEMFMYKVDV